MAGSAPNQLVVDAFKPVLDAAMEFASVDDAHFDGLHYLGGPNPDEGERKLMRRDMAELLADYVESRVDVELEHMRTLAALTEVLASLSYLHAVRDVLLERCEGGEC